MFAMIRNFVNGILTSMERTLKFWEGFTLVDTVEVKINMDYVINGIK